MKIKRKRTFNSSKKIFNKQKSNGNASYKKNYKQSKERFKTLRDCTESNYKRYKIRESKKP